MVIAIKIVLDTTDWNAREMLQGRLYITAQDHQPLDKLCLKLIGSHRLTIRGPKSPLVVVEAIPEAQKIAFEIPIYSRMTVILPGTSCVLFQFPCNSLPSSFSVTTRKYDACTEYELSAEVSDGITEVTTTCRIQIVNRSFLRGWPVPVFSFEATRLGLWSAGEIRSNIVTDKSAYAPGDLVRLIFGPSEIRGTLSLRLKGQIVLQRAMMMRRGYGEVIEEVTDLIRMRVSLRFGEGVPLASMQLPSTLSPQSFGASMSCWYRIALRLSIFFGNGFDCEVPIQVLPR
jgi:hypothetical protein